MGIRQLARELDLSIGTVSRALNDRPDVNAETRARVKQAAQLSGYVPNQSGRSLRSGRTGIVAAVIPTSSPLPSVDSGMFRVLEGVRRTVRRQSLDLVVLFRGPDEDPLENLQAIVQRRIADAVIISQTAASDARIDYLQAAGVDFVAFGRSAGTEDMPSVDFDFDAIAFEAARSFVRDGHRRLALVIDEQPMNYQDLLTAAFRAEGLRHGLPPSAVQVIKTRHARLDEAGRAAFARAETAPTAILAGHESIAAGLYRDLAGLGLRVGENVSVICTFPVIDTWALDPSLSHFEVDLDAAGIALGERLNALLAERPGDRRALPPALIPATFAPRASHRCAAVPLRA